MTAPARKTSSKERVQRYRERMRAKGLRPVTHWLPDTSTEAFKREAHRQSMIASQSEHAQEDQEFVDAISEWND